MDRKKCDQDIVEKLNALLELDYDCISSFVNAKIPCNRKFLEHPTVVVKVNQTIYNETYTVSLVGLLNGLLYNDGTRLAYEYDPETNSIIKFLLVAEDTIKKD